MLFKTIGFGIFLAAASVAPICVHAQEEHQRGGEEIECSSHNHSRQLCEVSWHDARIVRQLSDTQCVRDENWGIDRRGIWVDHGCSARFVATGDHGRDDRGNERGERGGGWQPEAAWNQRFSVTCESQDGRDHFCQVDLGGAGRATLERQLSSAPCVEGRNWGSNRAGVWVNEGCRAVFSIDRRWR